MYKPEKVLLIVLLLIFFTGESFSQSVEIKTNSARTRIYDTFLINWSLKSGYNSSDVEFRYKLDMPGDWLGGIQYANKKWSNWTPGADGNLTYSNFVQEGKYAFVVEFRTKINQKKIASSTKKFDVYWEYPEIQEEAFTINWNKVKNAATEKDKYNILSQEYFNQYQIWNQKFDYYYRLLKLTKSTDQLVDEVSKNFVETGYFKLLEKSAPSASKVAGKILLPKTIYDIISSGTTDLILIYRNLEANKACSMTVISYAAYKYFKNKAGRYKS